MPDRPSQRSCPTHGGEFTSALAMQQHIQECATYAALFDAPSREVLAQIRRDHDAGIYPRRSDAVRSGPVSPGFNYDHSIFPPAEMAQQPGASYTRPAPQTAIRQPDRPGQTDLDLNLITNFTAWLANHAPARARVLVLMTWSKGELVREWRRLHPGAWTAHPPYTWSKQELAWDICEKEFESERASAGF